MVIAIAKKKNGSGDQALKTERSLGSYPTMLDTGAKKSAKPSLNVAQTDYVQMLTFK